MTSTQTETLLKALSHRGQIDWEVCLPLADCCEEQGQDALARAWRALHRIRPKMEKVSKGRWWWILGESYKFLRRQDWTALPPDVSVAGKMSNRKFKTRREALQALAEAMAKVDREFEVGE